MSMIAIVFWFGTALGFVVGAIHAFHIITVPTAPIAPDIGPVVAYRALWAVVLWTAFGGYLLVLWIVGLVLRALFFRAPADVRTA